MAELYLQLQRAEKTACIRSHPAFQSVLIAGADINVELARFLIGKRSPALFTPRHPGPRIAGLAPTSLIHFQTERIEPDKSFRILLVIGTRVVFERD